MEKNKPARRDFIKLSALALGGLSIAPAAATRAKADKKLNILCLGAHPGDPEFGCGGTMARYSEAGHKVTFLYSYPRRGKPATQKRPMPKWPPCRYRRSRESLQNIKYNTEVCRANRWQLGFK